ncbi:MAG: hypothetical protein H6736_21505 [Alphaproteobacteria bacterium]|nr:hypothetical protein [Alphaproteobacteria bacterium]
MKSLLMLLAACGPPEPSETPIPTVPSACATPICISVSPDGQETGTLIASTEVRVCFWSTGLATQPPARVVVDGVELGVSAEDGASTCIGAGDLPERLPSGEIWVEQGTDLDGDGADDPGSTQRSNRLPIVTPPWVEAITPEEAVSGEEVTVTLANVPTAVSWEITASPMGTVDVLTRTPQVATVTPLWDSRGNACAIDVTAGRVETGAPAAVPRAESPVLHVGARLDHPCNAAPGAPCDLVGVGFGTPDGEPTLQNPWTTGQPATLAIDGVDVPPGPGSVWSPNTVRFVMPDLDAGPHVATLTTATGEVLTTEVTTLTWTRHALVPPTPGWSYDHEGAMFAATVGFTVPPFGALETRQVAFVPSIYGNNLHTVFGVPHPDLPFAAPSHTIPTVWQWDACTRPRATGIRDAVALATADPHFVIAGRIRGLPVTVDWDGLPSRTCEALDPDPDLGGMNIETVGEDAPGRWPAWSEDRHTGDRAVVAGLARFDFGVDPPIPDPQGRPGREVPILALRDDLAGTTEMFVASGAPLTPLYTGPLTGRGTLHEAGEVLYLAGGEHGFDGLIHALRWDGHSPVAPPVAGVSPGQLPAFTGSADGRLWSLVVGADGVVSLHVYDPVADLWSLHSTVPEAVVGAPATALAVDPSAHAVADVAVVGDTPALAVLRDVPTGVRLVVVAWDGDSWEDVGEPINGLREEPEVCVAHASDDLPPDPACPVGLARIATSGLRAFEDVPSEVRLLATDDGLYVRYLTDDAAGTHAWVAARLVSP